MVIAIFRGKLSGLYEWFKEYWEPLMTFPNTHGTTTIKSCTAQAADVV